MTALRSTGRDGATALARPLSPRIRVAFDLGPHVKPQIVTCTVIEYLGHDPALGARTALVEHQGKQMKVVASMVPGTWREVRP